ncbi:hypothetical protein K2F_02600 [Enterococcus thailandicus]|nr:hypothetical protein K2F_02600 [Enterococcus thailandicus]
MSRCILRFTLQESSKKRNKRVSLKIKMKGVKLAYPAKGIGSLHLVGETSGLKNILNFGGKNHGKI